MHAMMLAELQWGRFHLLGPMVKQHLPRLFWKVSQCRLRLFHREGHDGFGYIIIELILSGRDTYLGIS